MRGVTEPSGGGENGINEGMIGLSVLTSPRGIINSLKQQPTNTPDAFICVLIPDQCRILRRLYD